MEAEGRDPHRDLEDIVIYNQKVPEQNLFKLLTSVDDKNEVVRRDLRKREHLPTMGLAYVAIQREEARVGILQGIPSDVESSSWIGLRLKLQGRIDGTPTMPPRPQASLHGGKK